MTDTRACHCAQGAREPSDFEDVREVAAALGKEEDQTATAEVCTCVRARARVCECV